MYGEWNAACGFCGWITYGHRTQESAESELSKHRRELGLGRCKDLPIKVAWKIMQSNIYWARQWGYKI